MTSDRDEDAHASVPNGSRSTRPFRFKTEKHRHRSSDAPSHRSHKRRRAGSREHSTRHNPDFDKPSPNDDNGLDTDAAFRESLFDAMADDEGATYWEGIYGQPIHTYPQEKTDPETGELERMTEDEYVEYVRAQMWERTHQHIIEERKRYEEARARRKAEARSHRENGENLQRKVEESLRAGAERKSRREWEAAWKRYVAWWDADISSTVEPSWPVRSGDKKDISATAVRAFFEHAPGEPDIKTLMKMERVRWHPDKMQQRSQGRLAQETLKSVTAVFQIIDEIWNKHKT